MVDKLFIRDGQESVSLENLPPTIMEPIANYLFNLPGYNKEKKGKQVSQVLEQHLEVLETMVKEGFEVDVMAWPDTSAVALEARGIRFGRIPRARWSQPGSLLGAFLILQGHLLEHPAPLVHQTSRSVPGWRSPIGINGPVRCSPRLAPRMRFDGLERR